MKLKAKKQPAAAAEVEETRLQLLEAAGEVFAEVGFRNATVREICRRAEANIAAINYHFGDKERLYTEVLRHSHAKTLERYPPLLGVAEKAAPETKLRAFIHSLLLRIFDAGPTSWHGQLMAREMVEPSAALDTLVEERLRPMSEQLSVIVGEILGLPPGDRRVRRCALSVVSQCVFYKHCRPVMERLFPDDPELNAGTIPELAEHIYQFSLAAMNSFGEKKR